ncbi:MAG: hypothetical protein ACYTGG_10975 [Planctomycetota bacterium]
MFQVTGQVVFNQIGDPPLSGVLGGDSVLVSFLVDSNNFVDGVPGDVRAYEIDQSSFSVTFGGDITQGLIDPFPAGQAPYFGVIDGFPVSDGFFVSSSTVSPGGVPLEQDPFNLNVSLGYTGDTLSSLDILDAVGTYDFDGLTSFGFNLWAIFPDNVAMEIDFQQMTITAIPAPATLALLAPLALGRRRRRRG